jgi:hypothetical protein
MPVNHRHKCIFIHIAKCGGSSVNKVLRAHGGIDFHGGIPMKHHSPWWQLQEWLTRRQWQTYFKFAIIRNPWDRIVSQYEDHQVTRYEMPFKEFLKLPYLCPPCCSLIVDNGGGIQVDQVVQFENYEEEMQKIWNRIGIKIAKTPHMRKAKSRRPYREYYNWQMRSFVAHRYKQDIEYFGYTF